MLPMYIISLYIPLWQRTMFNGPGYFVLYVWCNVRRVVFDFFNILCLILPSTDNIDSFGSTIVRQLTFQDFAPGLEHLDLVNSGITEIDKVSNKVTKSESTYILTWHIILCYKYFVGDYSFWNFNFSGRILARPLRFSHGPFKQ